MGREEEYKKGGYIEDVGNGVLVKTKRKSKGHDLA